MLADVGHTWILMFNLVNTALIVAGIALGVSIKLKYNRMKVSILEAIRDCPEAESRDESEDMLVSGK